jgi:LPXTG-motif cell wall-anchored protein
MIKGPAKFLALLALALAVLFLVPTLAGAHYVPGPHPSTSHTWPKCEYKCPSASATPSNPVTASPSTVPSASKSASLSTAPDASPSASTGGALPVTGAKEDVMAGGGAALVLAGLGAVLWGRRRRNRVRFQA